MRAIGLILLTLTALTSGRFNAKLSPGDAAPAWRDLPGTDGRKHSLSDLREHPAVVLLFTCNSCPIAVDYEDRIIAFAKKYEGRAAIVAVNVNTIADDRLDKMAERAKEKKFPFTYIFDETQQLARDYGANYTPEFFVLDRDRKIAYLGAMDERTPPAEAGLKYLENAVDAVLAGRKPEPAETLARGCRIRFNRAKR